MADPWEEGEAGSCKEEPRGGKGRAECGCRKGGSLVITSEARAVSECSVPGPHGLTHSRSDIGAKSGMEGKGGRKGREEGREGGKKGSVFQGQE